MRLIERKIKYEFCSDHEQGEITSIQENLKWKIKKWNEECNIVQPKIARQDNN